MTATEELRNLLDERGVEWKEEGSNKTKWSHDGIEYVALNAWPRNGGAKTRLILHANLTPEQAIAATLGTGTCERVPGRVFPKCSACGATMGRVDNYCSNCGRKVVDE